MDGWIDGLVFGRVGSSAEGISLQRRRKKQKHKKKMELASSAEIFCHVFGPAEFVFFVGRLAIFDLCMFAFRHPRPPGRWWWGEKGEFMQGEGPDSERDGSPEALVQDTVGFDDGGEAQAADECSVV